MKTLLLSPFCHTRMNIWQQTSVAHLTFISIIIASRIVLSVCYPSCSFPALASLIPDGFKCINKQIISRRRLVPRSSKRQNKSFPLVLQFRYSPCITTPSPFPGMFIFQDIVVQRCFSKDNQTFFIFYTFLTEYYSFWPEPVRMTADAPTFHMKTVPECVMIQRPNLLLIYC